MSVELADEHGGGDVGAVRHAGAARGAGHERAELLELRALALLEVAEVAGRDRTERTTRELELQRDVVAVLVEALASGLEVNAGLAELGLAVARLAMCEAGQALERELGI